MNLGAVTTLVFDLDGVVWRGDAPIDSAISAINDLRAAGKRCLFCTNNSAQTQADFVAKLAGMGVEGVAEEEVITSSSATALYLSAQYTGPFLAYVIGGEGIHLALQKIGARIVPDIDIDDGSNVDCVVAGIDRTFTYEKLRVAQRLIRRGALFIATNRDATYPVEDGVIPGAGAIISAIETASGSTPVTIGKPRPVMVQLVMQKYGLQPHQIVLIGDRLDTDIVCARRAGVAAFLVTTGVTSLEQARRAKGELRPDAVFPDLTTFAEMVLVNSPSAPTEDDDLSAVSPAPPVESELTPNVATASSPAFEIVEETGAGSTPDATSLTTATTIETVAEEAPAPDSPVQAASPFSLDPAATQEPEPAAEPEPAPVAEEVTLETDSAEGESSNPAKLEGWDDSWFDENAEAENTGAKSAEPENEVPENSEANTADEAGTENSGFNWKLD